MIIERFTNRTATELKQNEKALADVLREAGADIKGRSVRCPFCDDKKPSGGIYQSNCEYRYKCHKCGFNGSIIDVIAKMDGLTIREVFTQVKSDSRPQQQPPTVSPLRSSKFPSSMTKVYPDIKSLEAAMPYPVENVFRYTCPNSGKFDMIVFRLITTDGKTFRSASPQTGGFVLQAPAKPWPLYNRKRIQDADTVVVVEGESCVHALHSYSITATTSPAGAGKAACANWGPLAGKNVILWPDNDKPGRAHMRQVEGVLQNLEPVPRISLLEPADLELGDKEDCVDFIKQLEALHADKTLIHAAIREALDIARPRGIAAGVGELIEDTISGKRQAILWPWSYIGGLTKALLPGTVTLLCGNVGASKSFMLLEAAAYWYEQSIKTALFELEEDRDFHLSRCLSQRAQISGMTDTDWIRDNPEQARALLIEYKTFLEGFGACIYTSPDTQPTLEQLAKWVRGRAKACRIIAIDPITAAAHKSRSLWEEDNAFLHDIKRIAVEHRCSIVLITHPIKAVSFPDVTQSGRIQTVRIDRAVRYDIADLDSFIVKLKKRK